MSDFDAGEILTNPHHKKRVGWKFWSLRTKLVCFTSLIIISVCSGLSWFLIQEQARFMKATLLRMGTTVATNLAENSRYSMITQDTASLQRIMDGAMTMNEVVYVVATAPTGEVLAARSKGMIKDPRTLTRSVDRPLYPATDLAAKLLKTPPEGATLRVAQTEDQDFLITVNKGKAGTRPIRVKRPGEKLYDFAVVIRRGEPEGDTSEALSLLLKEEGASTPSQVNRPKVFGVIQVGLTDALMLQSLNRIIVNIVLITVLIIVMGIVSAIVLANRIINPLQRLAVVAKRIANGDLRASVVPERSDEIGELTGSLNQMTVALSQREEAITSYVETITKQLSQLSTLNKTGTAIASTLEIDTLLDIVVKIVSENLGFTRMMLVLFDSERRVGRVCQATGLALDLQKQAKQLEIPVRDDGGIDDQLLLQGRAVLVTDLQEVADRMYPPVLEICRRIGVLSYVAAPLKSQTRVLGYLGADRGTTCCTKEDLDILVTVANHVAVALDNVRAYQQLEELNATLEERIHHRTQELQAANQRLQELDRLKSAFVSIVSHELRTPMTSIKGLVENMLDGLTGRLTDRQFFYLDRVKHNVERLTRMISDLLDLSRIEAGRMELQHVSLSVPDVVAEIVDNLRPTADGKSLSLRMQVIGDIPRIEADRDKLDQVLTNLVNNAIKFTEPGGEVRIEISQPQNDSVEISVIDTGCGIPEDEQRTIFDRFYRGQTAPLEARGAGLGLAISKSLVELHGGGIWVESAPGQGSRFRIRLPVHPKAS